MHERIIPPARVALAASATALVVAISGCIDDDIDTASPGSSVSQSSLQGTAAIGAPIVGGSVLAKCADGKGFTQTITTGADGRWSGTVDTASLPCALRVMGGNPGVTLHGYAMTEGVANITPLTEMILAVASSNLPKDWFEGGSWQLDQTELSNARQLLVSALDGAGYQLPPGDPLSTAFAIGDAWDQALDQLGAAIDESSTVDGFEPLLTLLKDGNLGLIPSPPSTNEDDEEQDNDEDIEGPSNLSVLTAFAGTYNVTGTATQPESRGLATRDHERGSITIFANGAVDFDTGIRFTATDIGAIYDRRNICDLEPHFDRAACRIHVNYDADDSGRKLEIYLDLDKTTVLEIRYQDGQGGRTRAAIGSKSENEEVEGPEQDGKARLNGQYGITGLVDGVEYTYTGQAELSSQSGRKRLSYFSDTDEQSNWQLHLPQQAGTYQCGWSADTAHILLWLDSDNGDQVTPAMGGHCTLTLISVDGDFIEGHFEGQMYGGSHLITSGYFIHPLE